MKIRVTTLRRLRRVVQYLTLALFFYLVLWTRHDAAPLLPADTFFRLDPLAAIASMLAGRQFLPALLWAIGTIVLTLALGRVWCGWLCPMGTVLDIAASRAAAGDRPAVSPRWRTVKYVLLGVILVLALLGNQTLMILDPITLITRTTATAILPALDAFFTAIVTTLYPIRFLQGPLGWLDSALRGPILPAAPRYYTLGLLIAVLFAGILALNRLASRFWCRYLCPLGGLLGLLSRVALLRRFVTPACISCKRCSRLCPTGTIDASAGFASDPAECTVCLDCADICPTAAITFPVQPRPPAPAPTYAPGRRQWLGALGTAVAAAVVLRIAPLGRRISAFLIRPPGGRENDLPSKCIRCGECLKVCPTAGLQPALDQDGPASLWTPVLVPRIGYCDYSCNACGRICPSGAIPALDLDVKRTVIIGQAHINRDRCIPWSDNRSCTVCEEMCPVPDKAIKLEDVDVIGPDGQPVRLRRPHVERQRCIGCGICEYQCPVAGEAAIRVYAPTDLSAIGGSQ